DRPPHQPLDDFLLGLEVEVHRPLRDSGAGRDVLDPRRREPLLDEEVERRIQHLVRPGFRPPPKLRPSFNHLVHALLITDRSVISQAGFESSWRRASVAPYWVWEISPGSAGSHDSADRNHIWLLGTSSRRWRSTPTRRPSMRWPAGSSDVA